jgi:hypothetical protein
MAHKSWRQLIDEERAERNDQTPEVWCGLSVAELDRRFDTGFGCTWGTPFLLWTEERVYFAVEYDGAESVGSVPRNPCDEGAKHFGG